MTPKGPRSITQINQQKRRAAIERDYINGISSVNQLAVRHGCSPALISIELKRIYKAWQEQEEELKNDEGEKIDRDTAVRMFEQVYRLAGDGYRRSRQDKEQIKTEYRRVGCKSCKATGWKEGDEATGEWCKDCQGDGEKTIEVVTRSITGQAGDPAFLRVANDSVKQMSLLRALYPEKPYIGKEEKSIAIGRAQLNIMIDQMPPELILAVKMALANRGSMEEVRRLLITGETKLIEVTNPRGGESEVDGR